MWALYTVQGERSKVLGDGVQVNGLEAAERGLLVVSPPLHPSGKTSSQN